MGEISILDELGLEVNTQKNRIFFSLICKIHTHTCVNIYIYMDDTVCYSGQ